MNGASPLKHGFVDLAAILFVIGGVVSLAMTILALPINISNPLSSTLSGLSITSIVVLGVSLVCSLGAIHCFSLASKRMLSEAGVRGLVFGALLLIFSFGFAGSVTVSGTSGLASGTATLLTALSAILILIAGIVCFSLRHTAVSASPIARQHALAQPVYQP